jgi:hypothetical protein
VWKCFHLDLQNGSTQFNEIWYTLSLLLVSATVKVSLFKKWHFPFYTGFCAILALDFFVCLPTGVELFSSLSPKWLHTIQWNLLHTFLSINTSYCESVIVQKVIFLVLYRFLCACGFGICF